MNKWCSCYNSATKWRGMFRHPICFSCEKKKKSKVRVTIERVILHKDRNVSDQEAMNRAKELSREAIDEELYKREE